MEKNTFWDNVVETGSGMLLAYAISRFVKIAIARGQSMEPTIKNNQPLLMDCRAYKRREPRRDDLISFKSHQKKGHKIFLKRVIGIPGDEIQIQSGKVYINGELLREDYIKEPMKYSRKLAITVEEGKLFVMGDNRNNSLDSRSPSLGLVSIENDVIGVVKRVVR